eukprot:jgi/Chlat1/3507/Chrsp23S08821
MAAATPARSKEDVVADMQRPYVMYLRETKDGMFSSKSAAVFVWLDVNGCTFLSAPEKKVLATHPLSSIASVSVDNFTVKIKMPDESEKKNKVKERKFVATPGKAKLLEKRIAALKKLMETDPTTATNLATSAYNLEEGATIPDQFLAAVDQQPGSSAYIPHHVLHNKPPPTAIKQSASDNTLNNARKGKRIGVEIDEEPYASPQPSIRNSGKRWTVHHHSHVQPGSAHSLASPGGLTSEGSSRYEKGDSLRAMKLLIERQNIKMTKEGDSGDASIRKKGLDNKIPFDAYHCKYLDETNPEYVPRIGVMFIVDNSGVHIIKDGGSQLHAIWRKSIHFRFDVIARVEAVVHEDEFKLLIKKGPTTVYAYRFETSLPELLVDAIRPFLSQFDQYAKESMKKPPPLFDDKDDRMMRSPPLTGVEQDIKHSGRVRHLTHMLGVTLRLAKATHTEEELSAEVMDFMEALNTFLLEGKR